MPGVSQRHLRGEQARHYYVADFAVQDTVSKQIHSETKNNLRNQGILCNVLIDIFEGDFHCGHHTRTLTLILLEDDIQMGPGSRDVWLQLRAVSTYLLSQLRRQSKPNAMTSSLQFRMVRSPHINKDVPSKYSVRRFPICLSHHPIQNILSQLPLLLLLLSKFAADAAPQELFTTMSRHSLISQLRNLSPGQNSTP